MTKSIKIDFTKLEKALSLSEKWFDLGGGLYASKVGKEASKALFTSKRAAGRDYIVVDTKSRAITAKDTLADLAGFKKVEKAVILAASSYESTIKAEQPGKEKVAKAAKKPAKQASKPVQPAGLQFGPGLVSDKEGKITIASLLHAGKVYASRTVPAEFSARFKKYSADNQLLLYLQGGPGCNQVATYRGWLKEGRQVTKGQHGLKILAPRMVIKEDGTKAIDGLRLVTLFSVKQTELASQEA